MRCFQRGIIHPYLGSLKSTQNNTDTVQFCDLDLEVALGTGMRKKSSSYAGCCTCSLSNLRFIIRHVPIHFLVIVLLFFIIFL